MLVIPSHLTARTPTAVLPALLEATVPVDANDVVIKFHSVKEAYRILRVCAPDVLNEAKAAWRPLIVAIEPHDDALHLTRAAKECVELILS